MKIKIILIITFIHLVQYPIANDKHTECENKTILTTLDNEPAYLRRGCYEESDLFYIELVNVPKINYYVSKWIFPCEGIPEEFRIDGLPVLISGNILSSGKWNPCFPSTPNIRIAPTNIFELKKIKTAVK